MPGIGWFNPLPAVIGSEPPTVERVYRALRATVGIGGAGPEDSLEDLFRQAKAYMIGLALEADERATNQFNPARATDALQYYEELLFTPLSAALGDHEKQAILAERFTAPPASNHDEVNAALALIDPRFGIQHIDYTLTETTVVGRAFEDLAATEPFGGGRKSTIAPNYSTSFHVIALLDLAGVAPSPADFAAQQRGTDYLNVALPAWVNFSTVFAVGFFLDKDRLDLTAMR